MADDFIGDFETELNPEDDGSLDFTDIYNEDEEEAAPKDLGPSAFPQITKRYEDKPHKSLENPEYYKTALTGEGDISQRVHNILQKLLTTKDPKDRGVFRQQFIPAYWDFLSNVAKKVTGKIADPKKYLLRFGLLHPAMFNATNRDLFAKIIDNNNLDVPIFYLDEWFKAVGTGAMKVSSTDEVRVSSGNNTAKLQQLLEKAQGKLAGAQNLLRAKADEKTAQERLLEDKIRLIMDNNPADGFADINACYTDAQKRAFNEVQTILKTMYRNDHDLGIFFRDYHEAEADVNTLKEKIEAEGGAAEADTGAIATEFDTIRQMVKMTIGRQGNHFPLLTNDYFHNTANDIGTRENVVQVLSWIESIDAEAYCRIYRNQTNRIVPYVVLLPTYGDYGMCWEPFDRYNRASSRGRIAVPMYPKNLQLAVLYAVGDLRWQVAKEKASFYWMEEGITGNFYQWFTKNKMKGDLKDAFIDAYILWMTKESEGTMKLDKELRGTFWRYMPFTQPVKEKLKTRSFTYQELYQRDVNRSMSDGY